MFVYFTVLLGLHIVTAAPPLELTIVCGSQETDYPRKIHGAKSADVINRIDATSLCSFVHKALPKSVRDGKITLIGEPTDQSHASNDITPITVPPPRRFKNRIRVPSFKVPKLKKLKPYSNKRPVFAPRVGAPMRFPFFRARGGDEESSAERMERFKKGVQKMLHVVKVLGQIDQYLSERTRSIIDILSKTFTGKGDDTEESY